MLHETLDASRSRPPVRRPRSPAAAGLPGLVGPLLLCAALAAGVATLLARHGEASRDPSQPAVSEPAWRTAEATPGTFQIDTTLFPEDEATAEVRLHRTNTRQDILRFGSVASPLGFARIDIVRPGAAEAPSSTFFLDLARQAGDSGLALRRSAATQPLETKFGLAETSEVVLGGPGREASCIAWRGVAGQGALRLSGFLCAGEGRVVDRLALACLVDRLEARDADPDITAIFADAARRHDPECLPPGADAAAAAPSPLLSGEGSGPVQAIVPAAGPRDKTRTDRSGRRRVDSTGSVGRTKHRSRYLY